MDTKEQWHVRADVHTYVHMNLYCTSDCTHVLVRRIRCTVCKECVCVYIRSATGHVPAQVIVLCMYVHTTAHTMHTLYSPVPDVGLHTADNSCLRAEGMCVIQ